MPSLTQREKSDTKCSFHNKSLFWSAVNVFFQRAHVFKVQYSHSPPLSIKILQIQMSNMQHILSFIHIMMVLVTGRNYKSEISLPFYFTQLVCL